ncbi:MAG: ABC transporter ATP-binding protein [Clostridia bacterium]|nr:ABC transporter ATP-binding protein [Clostridia bacterium]
MIKIENLTVKYGKKVVYNNFSLQTDGNKLTCILGESGCGKTTLLNAVAGLLPYSGTISPVNVSYIFQSPRLIPYITVLKNLTVTGADITVAKEMLEKVGLADKVNVYPQTLSGGEAQRVSLVRAFLKKSEALLMDEPFSSLDLHTKLSVMDIFKQMQAEEERCAVFVTHDIDEALYLADRIIVMRGGAIIKDVENTNKGEFGANSPLREVILKTLLNVEPE